MLDSDQKITMDKQSTYMADNRKQWIIYSAFKVYSERFPLSIKFIKLEKKNKRGSIAISD